MMQTASVPAAGLLASAALAGSGPGAHAAEHAGTGSCGPAPPAGAPSAEDGRPLCPPATWPLSGIKTDTAGVC